MIYSMYPDQNISAWIVSGRGGAGCSAAVGYSILNRTSNVDVGKLMLKYNGGGHKFASGVRTDSKEVVDALMKDLSKACKEYMESEKK